MYGKQKTKEIKTKKKQKNKKNYKPKVSTIRNHTLYQKLQLRYHIHTHYHQYSHSPSKPLGLIHQPIKKT